MEHRQENLHCRSLEKYFNNKDYPVIEKRFKGKKRKYVGISKTRRPAKSLNAVFKCSVCLDPNDSLFTILSNTYLCSEYRDKISMFTQPSLSQSISGFEVVNNINANKTSRKKKVYFNISYQLKCLGSHILLCHNLRFWKLMDQSCKT